MNIDGFFKKECGEAEGFHCSLGRAVGLVFWVSFAVISWYNQGAARYRLSDGNRTVELFVRDDMKTSMERLQFEARKAACAEGGSGTGIPSVTAWRFNTEKIQRPRTENPYLYLVLDGMLRLYTPSGIMDYMAGQYSISQIDTPLSGTVLTFSEQRDFP